MKATKEEIIAREVSKLLLRLKGNPSGQEILDAMSNYCDADDAMLYALIGADIITTVNPRKTIKNYIFLVNIAKAKNESIIKSLISGGRRDGIKEPEFKLVAGFPAREGFNEIKGLESLYPMLCRLIIVAERQLLMANPFFDKSGIKKILPYMEKAAERGVEIKIISRSPYESSKRRVTNLDTIINALGKNCEVRYFGGSLNGKPFYLHAKFMVADDKMAYVGSANITETSLGNNIEVGTIFTGEKVKPLLDFFKLAWKHSNKMDVYKTRQCRV